MLASFFCFSSIRLVFVLWGVFFPSFPVFLPRLLIFLLKISFLHDNKIYPPYFQSLLIIISSKLTTFPSNRNKTYSTICCEFKCFFSKLSDENITHICKREWGCGIRQFNMTAFSFAFWVQYCRSGTALQHSSQNSQEPSSHLSCFCCLLV